MTMPDYLREMAARVSNWGRWGTDDRRGTLNLIDAAAVARGMAAARQGRAEPRLKILSVPSRNGRR